MTFLLNDLLVSNSSSYWLLYETINDPIIYNGHKTLKYQMKWHETFKLINHCWINCILNRFFTHRQFIKPNSNHLVLVRTLKLVCSAQNGRFGCLNNSYSWDTQTIELIYSFYVKLYRWASYSIKKKKGGRWFV